MAIGWLSHEHPSWSEHRYHTTYDTSFLFPWLEALALRKWLVSAIPFHSTVFWYWGVASAHYRCAWLKPSSWTIAHVGWYAAYDSQMSWKSVLSRHNTRYSDYPKGSLSWKGCWQPKSSLDIPRLHTPATPMPPNTEISHSPPRYAYYPGYVCSLDLPYHNIKITWPWTWIYPRQASRTSTPRYLNV